MVKILVGKTFGGEILEGEKFGGENCSVGKFVGDKKSGRGGGMARDADATI